MFTMLLALSAMQATVPEQQQPEPSCAVTRATVFVRRFADLPQEVRDDVLRHGAIAEAGEPFEESDAVVVYRDRPPLPDRRFVLGGQSNNDWFVWIDHGGFARHSHIFGFRPVFRGGAVTPELMLIADFEGEPCEAINAFLRGVTSSFEEAGGPVRRAINQ